MKNWITKARFIDWVSGLKTVSGALGRVHLARGMLPLQDDAERLAPLLKASGRIRSGVARALLRRQLAPFLIGGATEVCRRERVGWERYYGSFGDIGNNKALATSLVLKAPGPDGEKGVLYCSFEYNWMKLVAHHDARAILDEYYLVGATSGSPTDFASLVSFAGLSPDPIFIGVSNLADMEQIGMLRPVVEPLPLLASDWCNPDVFSPRPRNERSIDIVMVAAWLPVKRHWLLFEALRELPRDLRVVLVGRNVPGATDKDILALAQAMRVPQQLEVHANLEIWEVEALLCDARISTIFSRREGSCVAVAESLMADTPVAMMEGAHVGSRAYINSQTGVLLSRKRLARQLRRFLEERWQYHPRLWATRNISCHRSTERLNRTLRTWSLKSGRPWTQDIAPLCWRAVPAYVNPADEERLRPAVEELRRKHGVVIEKFPGERVMHARHEKEPQRPVEQAAVAGVRADAV